MLHRHVLGTPITRSRSCERCNTHVCKPRHVDVQCSSTQPGKCIAIDIDTAVDTTPLVLQIALDAASSMFSSEPNSLLQANDLSSRQIRHLDQHLPSLLSKLASPEDAVFLVKLLQDELVTGSQERAAGSRRTRPFRVAEIEALWGEELLAVCLSRWAISMQCSTVELKQRATNAFTSAMKQLPAQPYDRPYLLPCTSSETSEHSLISSLHINHQLVNTLIAATQQKGVSAVLLSTWPSHITARLIAACQVEDVSICRWESRLKNEPGLYYVQDDTWLQAVALHIDVSSQTTSCKHPNAGQQARSAQELVLVTANPARAQQACAQLDSSQSNSSVLLFASGSHAQRLRAALSSDSRVIIVDDASLAEMLQLTSNRLVMDGVVW